MNIAEAPSRNLLIRADSSSQIGLGHIMRDLVLAQQYPNDTITFACQNLPGNIIDHIPYPVHILTSNDPIELIELIISHTIDMVIFDHYEIDARYEKLIKEQTDVSILSLDDAYKPHHCDILLNHNISADSSRYRGLVPLNCELRCGSAYTLIRDEFKKEKMIPREKKYDLFISMGGADTTNLTTDILKTLSDSLNLCVVTTTANANLEELKSYTQGKDNISLHINSYEVAKLLNQSRLAIITPSVIVHEVLFMEIPFVAIKTADNQDDIYQYLKQHNYNVTEEWTSDSIAQLYLS
ncbi:MAG: UDP-2,4-diacetamido-2,4,6-trideoxy-beta-L-altropyranose hydrolase [Sulfuricurvum sp.]|jgi:UDP-2,4-diacetamido-2,4,6-trideoxy-beta-L-altropyranose hydrolase